MSNSMTQPLTPRTPQSSSNRQSSFFDAFKSRIRRNKRRSRQSWGSQTITQCVRQSINSSASQANDKPHFYAAIKDADLADLDARYARYIASESSVIGLVDHLTQYQRAWKDLLTASLALHTDLLFFNDRSSTHRCHAEQLLNAMQATNQTINQMPMQRLMTVINAVKDMRDEFINTKKRHEAYCIKKIELENYKKKVDELRSRSVNATRMARKEAKLRVLTSSFALSHRQLYRALEPFQPSLPSILNVPFCELLDTTHHFHETFAHHRESTEHLVKQLDETAEGDERDLCLSLDFDVVNEESDDETIIETIQSRPTVRITYRNPPYDETIPFLDYHRAFDPARAFSFDAPHAFNPPNFIAVAHIKNFIVTRTVHQSHHADAFNTHSHLYRDKPGHVRATSVSTLSSQQSGFHARKPSALPPPVPQSTASQITSSHHVTLHREPSERRPVPPRPNTTTTTTSSSELLPSCEPVSMSPPPVPLRRAPEPVSTLTSSTRPPPLPSAAPISAAVTPSNTIETSQATSSNARHIPTSIAPPITTPPRKLAQALLSIDTTKSRYDASGSLNHVVNQAATPSSIQSIDSSRSNRAQSPSTGTVFIHRLQRSPSIQSKPVVTSTVSPIAAVFTVQDAGTSSRGRTQRTPSSSPLAARLAMFEALTPKGDSCKQSPMEP